MIAAFRSVHQPVRAVMPLRFKVSPLLSYRTASEIVGVPRARVFTSNSKVGSWCVPVSDYRASTPLLKLLQGGIRRASGQPDSEHPGSPNMKIPVAEMVWLRYTKWFRRVLFFKILLAIPLAMAVPIFVPWLHEKGRMRSIKHAVWTSQSRSVLRQDIIERPDTMKKFQNYINPPKNVGKFFVMIGPHGTGKSTFFEQLAAESPGVIYICVPSANDQEAIVNAFISLFSKKISWGPALPGFFEYISRMLKFGAPKPEPETLNEMFQDFAVVAKQYQEKHGRPVTLIIDEINNLARLHPRFLGRLLNFAKAYADQGDFNVIFVCSDGIVPAKLKEYPGSSRAQVVTIGDFTRSEALEYITTKSGLDIDKPTAEKIADFTGNRIIDIKSIRLDITQGIPLEAIFKAMKEKAWEVCLLEKDHMSILQRISKKLLKGELITESEFIDLCDNKSVAQSFIDRNVFAVAPGSQGITTITFGSKVMETSIKEHLASKGIANTCSISGRK